MDLSRVSQGELIAGGGGILLFISLFLSWASGNTLSANGFTVSTSANAFNAFSFMWIIMLIVSILVVGIAVASASGSSASLPSNIHILVAILGVLLFGWVLGWDFEVDNAGVGAWLAFPSTLLIAFGGYDAYRATVAAARPRRAAPSTRAAAPSSAGAPPSPGPPPSSEPPRSSEPPTRRRPPT